MINWKTIAQLGMLAGSVVLLSACGASTWCDDCDDEEEEDVVYIEVEKNGEIEVERMHRERDSDDDYKS